MKLKVFNYLTRELEEFIPLHNKIVGMYVCGPTVYNYSHLGHAKVYITFDIVRRYLEYLGYKVRYVQNITDVGHLVGDMDEGEDKINKQAKLEQLEPMEIVETYTYHYFKDMDDLNIKRPSISPRASGHIPEQIELAEILIKKGIAYATNYGNVYFSVKNWPSYGKLSRKNLEQLYDGVRLDIASDKRDPRDFAIWRAAKEGHLMQWNSPWGKGFPGWHAECTVMALKYLGLPFDIHGGGLENIFPHNESEIAQAEAAYDKEFARYWILNNMVTVEGKKMGKSLGNAISLKQLFSGEHPLLTRGYDPMVVRFFILNSHYRQNTDFSNEALTSANNGYYRLISNVNSINSKSSNEEISEVNIVDIINEYKNKFLEAMNNDFNTPQALGAIFDFTHEINSIVNSDKKISKNDLNSIKEFYKVYLGDILGLLKEEQSLQNKNIVNDLMELIIDLRNEARGKKDYATADKIRNCLKDIGIELKDKKDGTVWEYRL